MRGYLFCGALFTMFTFGACLGDPPANEGGATDGGATSEAGDGGSSGDGSGSGSDGSVEAGKPDPTGTLRWVLTMDVPGQPDVRLAYDDSGDVIFATGVSGGASSFNLNGQSYAFASGLAVGKIAPNGSLAWLKVYQVTVDFNALDIAATSTGDVWILGGLIDSGSVQNWNGTPIAKATPSKLGDIFWANLSGSDGSFKSVFQMSTSSANGGIDHSGFNYELQSMRLARVGNQLVGAIGHHGPIVLPSSGSPINVNSGTGEAVTVFRADPVTGAVTSHDVYTGTALGLTPGAITVRPDKTMAVAINVASSQGQTITNAAANGGRGGISFSQTGPGTGTNPSDAYSWFLVTAYSSTDGVALAQPFNSGGDNTTGHVNLTEASSVSLNSTGNVEVGGHFIGTAVQMNDVTFTELASSEDSFMMTLSPTGSVIANPTIATTGTDGFASALFDRWDDLAATSVYGGTIAMLRSAPSASESAVGVSQFKILGDGGVSWNFGVITNEEFNPSGMSAVAVDPVGGDVAVGGHFTGATNFGNGIQSVPNGGIEGLFVIGRSP